MSHMTATAVVDVMKRTKLWGADTVLKYRKTKASEAKAREKSMTLRRGRSAVKSRMNQMAMVNIMVTKTSMGQIKRSAAAWSSASAMRSPIVNIMIKRSNVHSNFKRKTKVELVKMGGSQKSRLSPSHMNYKSSNI
ncbi:hypothetical protein ACLB2K_014625 [Fragaria x ananassa]